MKYITISGDTKDRPTLLCKVYRTLKDGTIKFRVINGEWEGALDPTGVLTVVATKMKVEGQRIVWSGDQLPARDYNESISIIERSLKDGKPIEFVEDKFDKSDEIPF